MCRPLDGKPSTTSPGVHREPSIELVPVDDPDARACEVELVVAVDARQLRRLAADQRAAGGAADLGGALDELGDLVELDVLGRDVVEEEERRRAAAEDVVDAVRGEIHPAPAKLPGPPLQHQLRADAVGRGGEEAALVEGVEAGELPEAGRRRSTPRRLAAARRRRRQLRARRLRLRTSSLPRSRGRVYDPPGMDGGDRARPGARAPRHGGRARARPAARRSARRLGGAGRRGLLLRRRSAALCRRAAARRPARAAAREGRRHEPRRDRAAAPRAVRRRTASPCRSGTRRWRSSRSELEQLLVRLEDVHGPLQKLLSGLLEGLRAARRGVAGAVARRASPRIPRSSLRVAAIEHHWSFFPLWWYGEPLAARDAELVAARHAARGARSTCSPFLRG